MRTGTNYHINIPALYELDKTGKLAEATSRTELARMVGYSEDELDKGIGWVAQMITRGRIIDEIIESPDGSYRHKFSLSNIAKMPRGGKLIKRPQPQVAQSGDTEVEIRYKGTALKLKASNAETLAILAARFISALAASKEK